MSDLSKKCRTATTGRKSEERRARRGMELVQIMKFTLLTVLRSRTDQTSSQLRDRTWDASYGIVFGSPPPTQQGQPPQPRTFKRSPSSQFRFFSASSTASLLVRPLRRPTPSSTTKSRLKTEDDDPDASLALKPLQNRRQARIPNPGEAAPDLDPSKARLFSISSELVDFSSCAQEDGVKSIAWNGELPLLRRFHTLFESLSQVAETLEEQTQLTWIPKDAKDMESRMWQSYGGMRNKNLKLRGVLLDVWLSTQGLDSLSRHHDKETKNILLWKKALKQSMKCPKPLSLDAAELSTFRESVEESIQGGGLSSFEDSVREPTHHDAPLPTTPPGSLSYQRDPGAKATYWDYTQYIGPNNGRVRVHYCASRETTERVIQKYFINEEVIGFDMEWKANSSSSDSAKDNVSLIQVASEQRIGLFHIARYEKDDVLEDLVAPALRTLMESSKVIKTGVNIKADCTRLRKHLGIESKGLFELSYLFKLVKYAQLDPTLIDRRLVKMSDQVEKHLGLPLWKGDVRTSNWAEKLGNEQILCK